MRDDAPAHGFVLCGGKSERMGRDKARVPFLGRALARVQAEKLGKLCSRVSLVSKAANATGELAGLEVFLDLHPEQAALSGVARALSVAETDWAVILAVDLPLVPVELLADLLRIARACGPGPVAPTDRGWIQPLASVWPRSALSAIDACLKRGSYSVLGALALAQGRILDERETAALSGYFPGCLVNVNDPEELRRAERAALERAGTPP